MSFTVSSKVTSWTTGIRFPAGAGCTMDTHGSVPLGGGGVEQCEREDDHNLQLNSGKQSPSITFMPLCRASARVRRQHYLCRLHAFA
jgi:hypothetical protein